LIAVGSILVALIIGVARFSVRIVVAVTLAALGALIVLRCMSAGGSKHECGGIAAVSNDTAFQGVERHDQATKASFH
jgi:hypothetical protein